MKLYHFQAIFFTFEADDNSHQVVTGDLGGGRYSVVVYDYSGNIFRSGSTDLLRLTVSGSHRGDVTVSGVQMLIPELQHHQWDRFLM